MLRRMTEKERQEFLAEPHIGGLSVAVGNDRPPHTTPIWYGYVPGGSITFFTETQGPASPRKARYIERAGVLSLTVQREEFPYKYVTVEGSAVGSHRLPRASSRRSSLNREQGLCSSRSGQTAG
jgi:nitroimidazol reductase NimA-like FMN-containing flavoprotein (pyridoxamine 5'-phosphate oxidase superfamily)